MQTAAQEQQSEQQGAAIYPLVISLQIGFQFFGRILKLWLPPPEAYGAGFFLAFLLVFPWRPAPYRAWPFWRWALWCLGWASLVAFAMQCVAVGLSAFGIGAPKP